jgi:hypothetical protein
MNPLNNKDTNFELENFEFTQDDSEEFLESLKNPNFVKRMKEIQEFFKENDAEIGG